MKIISQVNETDFVVRFPTAEELKKPENFQVVHDYVLFESLQSIATDWKEFGPGNIKHTVTSGCANTVSYMGRVQVGIRDMHQVIMPILEKHKYMQPEHIADRHYTEDDVYFKQYGLEEPRYKKGDPYPAYAYGESAIRYFKDGEAYVAFREKGSGVYNHVTQSIYNKFINPKPEKEETEA